ncbi:integrating conjugative element protein [Methylophaga thalassica]|jgi:integrating conjugative element protein (TIGR03765 family)|uniref:integrating conjugative element protein n=1 Tax=Methylophaga thalassica TaxID=40223 RepID=UPI002E7C28B8|nr:integrating conjugative element protein [Methylophaga thalassica]WVI83896.1 integrating conjugative element protein [Methylophaga thalassica]
MSRIISLSVLLILSTLVHAEPKVIFDSGRTINADRYLSAEQKPSFPKRKPSITSLITPITPEMSVGKVERRNVELPYLPSPLFLVGTDKISINWLSQHRQALIKAGAVGLIVNSKSASDIQQVIHTAKGLQISPASGSDLAKQLNLHHYPILITRTQIAQ